MHRARKRFGQNFLHDSVVIDGILRALGPLNDCHIVEIGPGQGALTRPLLAQLPDNSQLDLLELDRDLLAGLEALLVDHSNAQLHQGDALAFDFIQLQQRSGKPLRLLGNLPYNISTPLLFHLFEQNSQGSGQTISDMHFMLQREVVQRMAAAPGGKDYGRLSVMTQYHCAVEALFEVAPEAFNPAPKVTSQIVRLQPRPASERPAALAQALDTLTRSCFAQRRKVLRNTLKPWFSETGLEALGVDPGARAEVLPLETFVALAQALGDRPGA